MSRILTAQLVRAANSIPEDQRTAEAVARALYAVVRRASEDAGQNPDIETAIWSPDQTPGRYGRCWVVNWEAGPYEWATHASGYFTYLVNGSPIEPYYSFDLCIYETS